MMWRDREYHMSKELLYSLDSTDQLQDKWIIV